MKNILLCKLMQEKFLWQVIVITVFVIVNVFNISKPICNATFTVLFYRY